MHNSKLLIAVALSAAAIATSAVAGYLPLLHAGSGVGATPIPTFVLQTDGASFILLVDGVSKLQKAQP